MWLRLTVDHGHKISWRSHSPVAHLQMLFSSCKKILSQIIKRRLWVVSEGLHQRKFVIKLVYSKCLPLLLYGTEARPLFKSDLHSLDFVINRFFMKLVKTNNMLIINEC